jgi:RNA polymerase sigma-70 factor, ECF subfamily
MTGEVALPVLPLEAAPAPVVRAADDPAVEEALIERCVAGDAEAFRPLVQRYQRLAFSIAYRMLGVRADAEDVAQQAFVDAFSALDRFRGEGRKNAFSTWLVRIVVNRSKDVLKSKKRTEESLDDTEVSGAEAMFAHAPRSPEADLAVAQQRLALERALMKVPVKYREVLVLKDVEDLAYEEIRAILRLPITTLKIRVVRARAMMRAHLAGGFAPEGAARDGNAEAGQQGSRCADGLSGSLSKDDDQEPQP